MICSKLRCRNSGSSLMWRVFYLPPVVTFWLFLTDFVAAILAVSTANRGYPVGLMVRLLRAVLGRGQRRRKPSDSTLGTKRQNVFQPRPPFMDLSVSLTSVKDRKRPRSNFKIQVDAQLAPIFVRISISKGWKKQKRLLQKGRSKPSWEKAFKKLFKRKICFSKEFVFKGHF